MPAAGADLVRGCYEQRGLLTNIVVQQLGVSLSTPMRCLDELEKGGYLQKTGTRGAETEYG